MCLTWHLLQVRANQHQSLEDMAHAPPCPPLQCAVMPYYMLQPILGPALFVGCKLTDNAMSDIIMSPASCVQCDVGCTLSGAVSHRACELT